MNSASISGKLLCLVYQRCGGAGGSRTCSLHLTANLTFEEIYIHFNNNNMVLGLLTINLTEITFIVIFFTYI